MNTPTTRVHDLNYYYDKAYAAYVSSHMLWHLVNQNIVHIIKRGLDNNLPSGKGSGQAGGQTQEERAYLSL